MDLQHLREMAIEAAKKSAKVILEVYDSDDFDVEIKGDESPLTRADKASHEVIVELLAESGLPVLSEEGKNIDYSQRSKWEYFWMVDPIDGTKEFIKRNGEFTVNIALIHFNRPILGVVLVPVTEDLYVAVEGHGAEKNGNRIHVNSCSIGDQNLRVVASRSHMNDETSQFMEKLNDPTIVSKGSSLKLLMVAEGEADIYPRYAPTMEWDTAAAHIIVEEAGGMVLKANTQEPLSYNKKDLLNPWFLVKSEISDL